MRLLPLLVLVLLVFGCADALPACPTCAEGMSNDENAASLVNGYFWSIVFMMSMPFTIFSGIGLYFYLQVRKARQLQPAPPLPEAQLPPGLVLPGTKG